MKNILKSAAFFLIPFLISGCLGFGEKAGQYSGTLEITEHAVGARAAGRIGELLVKDGDAVTKGQRLAVLDRYEQFKKEYERALMLFKTGGVDRQTLEHAQIAMEDQEILSPVDGVVLLKVRESGEVVAAGSAVVVIGDTSQKWVKIFVPEGAVNRIHLNDTAEIHFDGISQKAQGHVKYISTKMEFTPRNVQTAEERVTQMIAIKIYLDDPTVPAHPGTFADVILTNRES